jgi:hypothetical protein
VAFGGLTEAFDNRLPVWYSSPCTHKYIGRESLSATRCEVRLLEIPDGASVIHAECIICTAAGVDSEYLEAVWCGDHY